MTRAGSRARRKRNERGQVACTSLDPFDVVRCYILDVPRPHVGNGEHLLTYIVAEYIIPVMHMYKIRIKLEAHSDAAHGNRTRSVEITDSNSEE